MARMIQLSVAMVALVGCSSSSSSPVVVDQAPDAKPSAELQTVTLYVAGMNQRLQIL